jgi:hypothetical protein
MLMNFKFSLGISISGIDFGHAQFPGGRKEEAVGAEGMIISIGEKI